ncbi:ABC transporter permease [Actinomadura sp. 1N219]|uniref:ABC transporter permease n=1 Tax=Actinomadura sp. 1N219 TaxID=3375152 RepID=UPI0037AA4315
MSAGKGMVNRRGVLLGIQIGAPVLVLLGWGLWSAGSMNIFYPPLTTILDVFQDTWLFERVGSDVVPSLANMLAGFALSIVIGVPLGILIGLRRTLRTALAPVIEFVRAIPPPALIPFGIVVLGVGTSMKVFIILMVGLFPVLMHTIDGVRGVDPGLLDSARAYRVGRRDRLVRVVLPAAAPQIFAGMRVSLSLSLILMVISEMVASTRGIGYFILESQRTFAIPEMWSGMVLLGILGYLFNLAFGTIERRALRWHHGARKGAS